MRALPHNDDEERQRGEGNIGIVYSTYRDMIVEAVDKIDETLTSLR